MVSNFDVGEKTDSWFDLRQEKYGIQIHFAKLDYGFTHYWEIIFDYALTIES